MTTARVAHPCGQLKAAHKRRAQNRETLQLVSTARGSDSAQEVKHMKLVGLDGAEVLPLQLATLQDRDRKIMNFNFSNTTLGWCGIVSRSTLILNSIWFFEMSTHPSISLL